MLESATRDQNIPPSVRLRHLWPSADQIEAIETSFVVRRVPTFPNWLNKVTPTYHWEWPHQQYLYKYLDRVTSGDIKRLMIFIPPRHTKSETVTVRYPVWRLERTPNMRIIIGAYNQTLANKFSRKARRIAAEQIPMSISRAAVEEWETKLGGGLRAIGVGGGITGQGGDLIVIDDPVKSREEAESFTYREKVWEWYKDDLYTRLEPNGAIVLIMTRWHEDDLAGRLMAEMQSGGESWDIVSLPALAEDGDPLGRKEGEALCPERYDEAALQNIKMVLGDRSFNALYQQRPSAREGNMFKLSNLPVTNKEGVAYVVPKDEGIKRIRYWDLGGSDSNKADYSVGVRMSVREGIFYVEDVKRGQWSPRERNEQIKATAESDRDDFGHITTWIEKVPGLGVEVIDNIVRFMAGFGVKTEMAKADKVTRADPFADQCEAGNVRVIKADWNKAYRDELTGFPNGKNDDQVDASSGAFSKLASVRRSITL